LTEDQLKAAAKEAYPDHIVTRIWLNDNPDQAVEIALSRDDVYTSQLFHPYTGEHLGSSEPAGVRFVFWLIALHDDLLYAETGRFWNGIGAVFLVLLCFSGGVIWWPGIGNLRRSLVVDWNTNWKRMIWGVHSMLGFWTFLFIFMWAISGVYFVWPDYFSAIVDYFEPFDPTQEEGRRVGDGVLRWIARLHFGRFGGWSVKTIWAIVGLIPPALFVTGALMWWNRVLRPARIAQHEKVSAS
jgi:uncharacterized iron-regulated membrane protein